MKNKALTMVIACLLLGIIPGTGGKSLAQAGTRFFPETGKTVKGRFLEYWNTHGGLAQQGYPISEELSEKSDTDGKVYTMQYFQRAVFEYHPEFAGTPNEVLLSLLGVFFYNKKYVGGAAPQITSTDNPRLFNETGFSVGGAFRRYWETHGGLAQQGYPISEEFREVSDTDGRTYTVQYFERAVFEYHPEFAGTPNEVLLSLLGVFFYNAKHGGSPPPTGPTATPTPVPPAGPTATPTLATPAQIFLFQPDTATGTIGQIDTEGNYRTQRAYENTTLMNRGWTHVVPVGHSILLFYNAGTGLAYTVRVLADGALDILKTYDNFLLGWTRIVSRNSGLDGYLLFYKYGSTFGITARVDAEGNYSSLTSYNDFYPNWLEIAPGSSGHFLFYDPSAGKAATVRMRDNGSLVYLKSYDGFGAFDNLAPGPNNTFLFYRYSNGAGVLGQIADDGTYTTMAVYPDAAKGYPSLRGGITRITTATNNMTFFYSGGDGRASVGRLQGGAFVDFMTYPPGQFAKDLRLISAVR